MKNQYLTQVIIGEHKTTAIPMWAGYGTGARTIPTMPMQTYLSQRLSTSKSKSLYLSSDLKQYINELTGNAQRVKVRGW